MSLFLLGLLMIPFMVGLLILLDAIEDSLNKVKKGRS